MEYLICIIALIAIIAFVKLIQKAREREKEENIPSIPFGLFSGGDTCAYCGAEEPKVCVLGSDNMHRYACNDCDHKLIKEIYEPEV